MNAKYKRKWIKALRSRKYKQCTGRLHVRGRGFCCLGVACDVVKDEILTSWTFPHAGASTAEFLGSSSVLPQEVITLLDLSSEDGGYTDRDGKYHNLAGHNDDGMSFHQIADVIERYF